MVAYYQGVLGLTVMNEIDSVAPPEGDHTGIPGALRSLVFTATLRVTTLSSWPTLSTQPAPTDTWTDTNSEPPTSVCFNVTGLEALHKELTSKGVKFVTDPIITGLDWQNYSDFG
jgi:hypothetical protein